ncbi:replication initiation protein [Streptacidiphilus sp. PB12-B1b]|uniref:replication initiator protein RepSA n=1 Tax=Streptacidiphilus sp. PB12-B1b TaxID=2705012 RepID=UPI0015F8A7B6|nr:replication initiator protein RepSA [Streptacidiphilus sp. PB12-B1b]QMU75520.1 replication initiation protein [Streptacidiphilus sp. PB12-B1b]
MPAEQEYAAVLDLARLSARGDLPQLAHQLRRTSGCANPIHLQGFRTLVHAPTGQILHRYATDTEPGHRLRVACGNRRASRCPSCARTYAGDTFHLIRAGLVGDQAKGVPDSVRSHPRVFATLTAPSFGPVHNRPQSGACRCGTRHPDGSPVLGTPLDPERYDYAHAVLWNNHAPELWRRFTIYLRRDLARAAGLTSTEFSDHARVSFGKVAEYQRRGAVHFHAVIRIDGPEGASTAPPPWATVALLDRAIRSAARRTFVPLAQTPAVPALVLRWGTQVDVRPIRAFGDGSAITELAVASYVAKYATKSAEATESIDRRITERHEIAAHDLPDHTRRLIETCWDLDDQYPDRKLAHWSHMIGFRGHFSSKSPAYSTTLGALRQIRADFRAEQAHADLRDRLLAEGLPDLDDLPEAETLVLAHWAYAGSGLTPGESLLAAGITEQLEHNRTAAREESSRLAQEMEE